MKKLICILASLLLLIPTAAYGASESSINTEAAAGIDYMVLVNKLNQLPEGWEEALETVTLTNSVDDEVEVEKKAYDAYLLLKDDLETNEGIYLELDSARRSVAAQQEIMDRSPDIPMNRGTSVILTILMPPVRSLIKASP